MRRPSTLILLLLIAFALAAVPAGAAKRAQNQPLEVGLQDDQVFVAQNLLTPQKGYDLAKQLGVSRLRINLGWAGVVGDTDKDAQVPHPVPYDWSDVDRAIDQAAANGQRAQLTERVAGGEGGGNVVAQAAPSRDGGEESAVHCIVDAPRT